MKKGVDFRITQTSKKAFFVRKFSQEVPHKKCTIARCANIFLGKRTLVSVLGGGTKTLAGAMA